MEVSAKQIRSYRLYAHHLDEKLLPDQAEVAAGACGLQNTPPGAWQTALFNRLNGCTLPALDDLLYEKKTLLQAWSFRGVPAVFPAQESDIFLTPLIAKAGEEPWIYTRGITGALEHMQMGFDDLLQRTKQAAGYLDSHTIKSKEALDQTLAGIIAADLPEDKKALWQAPSMYGSPDKQTVGGAAVSFLLRPCSFHSLVVFGRRQGASPTFTSCKNWLGKAPARVPDADKKLVRKFLHAYGPAKIDYFANWLGCSPRQARRLWGAVSPEMEPLQVEGKTHYILQADKEKLLAAETDEEKLLLLGAHDPYLDLKDRAVILENRSLHKTVWQYVSNPGVVLKGGCIIGIWKAKTTKEKLDISMQLWCALSPREQQELKRLAEAYAAFRLLQLQSCVLEVA